MGAWGTGVFDNDEAADFADEVAGGGGIEAVEEALDRVLDSEVEYLELPDAAAGLVAAEIVARLHGRPGPASTYAEGVDAWIAEESPAAPAALVKKARAAIARILTDSSEMKELWLESDDFDEWKRAVDGLTARL